MEMQQFNYDNRIVKNFAYATMLWGIVGMLVGLLAAFQMYYPGLNFKFAYTTFGRIRPLHTNAVIFAFVGNGIFMGVYYSLQRLLKARMFSDLLSNLHFWGWQAIIVSAALTLPFGITQGKEYASTVAPAVNTQDLAYSIGFVAATKAISDRLSRGIDPHIILISLLAGGKYDFTNPAHNARAEKVAKDKLPKNLTDRLIFTD